MCVHGCSDMRRWKTCGRSDRYRWRACGRRDRHRWKKCVQRSGSLLRCTCACVCARAFCSTATKLQPSPHSHILIQHRPGKTLRSLPPRRVQHFSHTIIHPGPIVSVHHKTDVIEGKSHQLWRLHPSEVRAARRELLDQGQVLQPGGVSRKRAIAIWLGFRV